MAVLVIRNHGRRRRRSPRRRSSIGTTGESGVAPFYTTRYQWKGDRNEQAGRVPYERLSNAVRIQFYTASERRPKSPSKRR